MLFEILFIFNFLNCFFYCKNKQKYKLFETKILHLSLELKEEFSKYVVNRSLINLSKELFLFLFVIGPVIFHLFELFFLYYRHLILVVLISVDCDIGEIFE